MAKKAAARKRRTRARAAEGERAPTLVYIHGIGQQEPPAQLELLWDHALFGRSLGERSRMAYWADLRHPVEAAGSIGTRSLERRDLDDDGEEGVDVGALVREAGVPARKRGAAEAWGEGLRASLMKRAEARPRTRGVRAKVLPLPAWMRKRITEQVTRLLIRDTAAYLFDPAQKRAMQARLRDVLTSVDGPVVLVSHSQGTIISYDVLTALRGAVDVPLWVTLGSPLGIQEVQDNVAQPLRAPAGVAAWRNFADLLDPVALDKGLASDFQPKGFVRDTVVVNRHTLKLWGFNPHAALGYLSTDDVRAAVAGAAGNVDRLARFVVARDVATAMADPVSRLPVLIELRDPDDRLADGGTLTERRDALAAALEGLVERSGDDADDARIDPLRRFVSARLTAAEIRELELSHEELHVYAVWKNARKRKLLDRSANVVQAIPAHGTYAATGKGVTWAVLDTGVRADHPHFAGRESVAALLDCTRTGKPVPAQGAAALDRDGHGTHVCGIIAGRGEVPPKGKGEPRVYSGVAPDAKLAVYKVLSDDGDGEDGWIIKALDHIAELNESSSRLVVHGVNLSLGGWFDPEVYGCGHSPICAELRRLWQQGVVVCVACGNEGQITVETDDGGFELNTSLSIGDPANLEECIAVGSVNADKPHLFGISWFSSRGPTADGRAKPDLVAPGERITSASSSFAKSKPATHYVAQSGTSMACPHVSGIVAAFLSVRREFIGHPDHVKRILLESCTDLGRDRYHQGRGLPNLMRMLAST